MLASKVFSKELEVRFKDIDSLGHVNNAVILTYYEECRKAFFTQMKKGKSEFNFIVANIECNYYNPIMLNCNILVKMEVNKIGRKSFSFRYVICDKENHHYIFTEGTSVQVFFDYDSNKSKKINKETRELLSQYYYEKK